MKRIVLLGSTGSIGVSTLDVLEGLSDRFKVIGLSAGRNATLLAEQSIRYRPEVVGIMGEDLADDLARHLAPSNIRVLSGPEGLLALARHPEADLVINALVGSVGLLPTLKAIEAGKDVAIANKEPLVIAGDLLVRRAAERGAHLLPMDSEPSALWQCLQSGQREEVRRIILTASGGPFFHHPLKALDRVTPEEALRHPTWRMGRKITVDSATLMNKGFEVIEASWLFGIPVAQIGVVIHRQSIVHSMVEFIDGSVIAQMGPVDMRLPIQYALTYPERLSAPVGQLDLTALGQLTFAEPDIARFPGLSLCYRAAEAGGTMAAVLSAANEVAVEAFLAGRIPFTTIPRIDRAAMDAHQPIASPSVEAILEADRWARRAAAEAIKEAVSDQLKPEKSQPSNE